MGTSSLSSGATSPDDDLLCELPANCCFSSAAKVLSSKSAASSRTGADNVNGDTVKMAATRPVRVEIVA
jgi:hypothetical protein